MKYCSHCGQELDDEAVVCIKCGCSVEPKERENFAGSKSHDAPSGGFAFLGFLFPLIGLILYIVWKNEYPLKAKSCGKGALIGFIVSVFSPILYDVIVGA